MADAPVLVTVSVPLNCCVARLNSQPEVFTCAVCELGCTQVPADPLFATQVNGEEQALPQLAQFWFVPIGVQVVPQHTWPAGQPEPQPPATSHVPVLVLQVPERQTTLPLKAVQGPSPVA